MPAPLVTIDSEYLAPELAACYLRVQDGEAAVIETNTARALPRVLAALERERVSPEQVRWIVVTHVHLDHAGGAAALLARCPNASVVAHPRAARHLIDPAKLVASATAVYGEARFLELYGEIAPIPEARVRVMDDGEALPFGRSSLRFLHARGHANHHFVVHDPARDTVFTGDAFGLVYPRLQRAGRFAFPSTSPTDFDAVEARRSLNLIAGLGTRSVCLTHFGCYEDVEVIGGQLRDWLDVSEELVEWAANQPEEGAEARLRARLERELEAAASRAGLELDAGDRALLELDLELNAQGLAYAASKRPGGSRHRPAE